MFLAPFSTKISKSLCEDRWDPLFGAKSPNPEISARTREIGKSVDLKTDISPKPLHQIKQVFKRGHRNIHLLKAPQQ